MPQELLMEGMTMAKTYRCNLQVLHTDQPRLIMAKLHHSRAEKEYGKWQLYYLTLFRAAPSAVSKVQVSKGISGFWIPTFVGTSYLYLE